MQERKKKHANVLLCVRRRETERVREKVSVQKRGREAERQWQTWPEGRKGVFEKDNPWETVRWTRCPVSAPLPLSPPVCFAMVTRQGSQCSQLMCFSAAGLSWVLMCLSLSFAQSMSTVLGWTNTQRSENQGTLSNPGWVSG